MLFHTPLYIFFSRRGNCRYNAGARRIAFSDGFIASPRVEKPCRKTGVFGAEKRKLVFRAFIPHLGKEKICLTYFEICQTYFKIQGTYFFPPELPLKHAPKRQTKRRHAPAGAGDQRPFGRKTVCYMPRKCGQIRGMCFGRQCCRTMYAPVCQNWRSSSVSPLVLNTLMRSSLPSFCNTIIVAPFSSGPPPAITGHGLPFTFFSST